MTPSLYVGQQQYSIAAAAQAVSDAISKTTGSSAKRSVLVYLHGKGKEPGKSQSGIIPRLEARYSTQVLMVHWPHEWTPLGFPESEARQAASSLAAVAGAITQIPGAAQKCVLLSHSMGAFGIQQFAENGGGTRLSEAFGKVVLASPAVGTKRHAEWLSSIGDRAFVFTNRDDPLLGKAGLFRGRRLGKRIASNDELAPRATYFDVTNTGAGHRYFLGVDDFEKVEDVFASLIAGESPDLAGIIPVRDRIYPLGLDVSAETNEFDDNVA